MSNLNITKKGQLKTDINHTKYLVNNFSETNTTTGWTLTSGILANGICIMSATNPNILSPYFNVGLDDIICIEWTVSLPTPSTTTSGPGLYLGTPGNQGVFVHTFNHSTKTWTQSTSANNNPYFLNSYNLTTVLTQKHYVIGANVNLSDVPWGETTNTSYPARAIQLTSSLTNTRIRSGYNSNTAMVIQLSNVKVYNITQKGFYDDNAVNTAKFGKNWVNAYQIIEY